MLMDLSTDPYLPTIVTPPGNAGRSDALAYIDRQIARPDSGAGYSFCAADIETDEAVGTAGLHLASLAAGRTSAAYSVAPRSRGHGVAGQAPVALTGFAWSMEALYRVELSIEPWNLASVRTAERAGYEREGLLRSHQVTLTRTRRVLWSTESIRTRGQAEYSRTKVSCTMSSDPWSPKFQ